MTAKEFFENQLITDANSVIDITRHKYSRNDLIRFAEAYRKSNVKNLNIPCVVKSGCEHHWITIGNWDGVPFDQCTKCNLFCEHPVL